MARIYENGCFFIRTDQIAYLSKSNENGDILIYYFLRGNSLKFAIKFNDTQSRDEVYELLKKDIATNL